MTQQTEVKFYLFGLFCALRREFQLNVEDYLLMLRALHYRLRADAESTLYPLADLIETCQLLWVKDHASDEAERIEQVIRSHAFHALQDYQQFALAAADLDNAVFESHDEFLEQLQRHMTRLQPVDRQQQEPASPQQAVKTKPVQPSPTADDPVPASPQPADTAKPFRSSVIRAEKKTSTPPKTPVYETLDEKEHMVYSEETDHKRHQNGRKGREKLPVAPQHIRQMWHRYRIPQPVHPNNVVFNLEKTIAHIERHIGLPVPVFEPLQMTDLRVLLMVDNGRTMHGFGRQVNALVENFFLTGFSRNQITYFNTLPICDNDYELGGDASRWHVYADPDGHRACYLSELMNYILDGRILIISDGGASTTSTWNAAYVEYMRQFIYMLKLYARRIVWLNPVRDNRWHTTPAKRLGKIVDMHPYTFDGLQQAIHQLGDCV